MARGVYVQHVTFQSTLPARGATFSVADFSIVDEISIHAPCTGSDVHPTFDGGRFRTISIHAPCTGSDDVALSVSAGSHISIHAPCTGSDSLELVSCQGVCISIHAPCTGSDNSSSSSRAARTDFNPRSLHGERLASHSVYFSHSSISIHAPCTGSDRCNRRTMCVRRRFQSTLPARGATRGNQSGI